MAGGAALLLGTNRTLDAFERLLDPKSAPDLKFGLVTDLHYADKPPVGTRFYRQSIEKLDEVKTSFEGFQPSFTVELGDFVDAADMVELELAYLKKIHDRYMRLPGDKHFVLGNHCVHTLTKQEFLAGVNRDQSYYSFDLGGFHFVVLDACFRKDQVSYGRKNFDWTDSNIPPPESKWLAKDLAGTDKKTIVFAHQRLDEKPKYSVINAKEIRSILEANGNVIAVFQGHSHANDYQQISGIHYCTLVAMVEGSGPANNGAAQIEAFEDGSIRIRGLRKQKDYQW